MKPYARAIGPWTRIAILVGAGLFIVALIVSAAVVPALRPLHAFQALIYVAVVMLARRGDAVGFGAGVFIACAWNGLNLFVTHLMQAGAREWQSLLRIGHVNRPDTMMVFLGGVAHFVLIAACLAAMFQLRPGTKEWMRFVAGGLLALAYFAAIVATMAPR
jgi:hypothetical protein